MTRKVLVSFVLIAFVAMASLMLTGCPKKADDGATGGPALPGLPSMPKVSKSGDTVNYSGKDEKGNAVNVTSTKEGESAKTTVKTDQGTLTTEVGKDKVSEKDLGIAFYPGATVETGMNAAQSGAKAGAMQMVNLKTADPFAKVAAFYKGKYAKGNTVVEQGEMLMITIKSGQAAGKMIMASPSSDKQGTQIVIHSASGM
ncbi:MAG: hypothetical protein WCP21_12485 [Armatimonadota bacterium]